MTDTATTVTEADATVANTVAAMERAYAKDDQEAKARAHLCYDVDPLRAVMPSLLSSADISQYVRETGMLFPFDESKLKTASYEVRPRGQFIYWQKRDGKIDPVEETITDETKSIRLPANSISYVQAEPQFRLPLYIALRFNLRIKHVHRGILLGTGPIVDPGFSGKLLIPIHNLTSTDYILNLDPNDGDDGLIWVEFTKTTFDRDRDKLAKFDEYKKDKSPKQYLREANGGNPILSSIHDAIDSAKISAQNAEASAKLIRNVAVLAAVPIVLAVGALIVTTLNTVNGSLTLSNTIRQNFVSLTTDTQKHEQDLAALKKALAIETSNSQALATALKALEQRVNATRQTDRKKTTER